MNLADVFSVDANGNGFFGGNLTVNGTVSKGGGSFKIDDPVDPANKALSHSFVESPDKMNIYNGNVVTDRHGLATVELPAYFDSLNGDFRYQLTVVGQFAQAIVVDKVHDNRFVIKTNKPGVEVSWQVTGIRHNAYANAYRIPVEEVKSSNEQGHYLHPELFAAGDSKALCAPTVSSPPPRLIFASRRQRLNVPVPSPPSTNTPIPIIASPLSLWLTPSALQHNRGRSGPGRTSRAESTHPLRPRGARTNCP